MGDYATTDDLLAAAADEYADVILRGGKTVRVRGLSRYEWFLTGKLSDGGDANKFEQAMVQMGMVEPPMSSKQVEEWRNRPGTSPDLHAVSRVIRELSGQGEGADKSDPGGIGE